MTRPGQYLSGVIEGFYGRPWSFQQRLAYARFLRHGGLNTYIYCPKADPWLRKRWFDDWPAAEWQQLVALAGHYRDSGVNFGMGLSPFALYQQYGPGERAALQAKVQRLLELDIPLLAVLFDDMPGDLECLAERQAQIINDIHSWIDGRRLLVCPTYYSFDPVLETHFGAMPPDYWPRLGAALPDDVDVFWTGNAVCSQQISAEDVLPVNELLGRPVLLWDNYPVNDGAVRSQYLYGEALSQRSPELAAITTGHLCNPMNEALLSLPALSGLSRLVGNGAITGEWLGEVMGDSLWQQLQRDFPLFQSAGLAALREDGRAAQCEKIYAGLPGPAAVEVVQWLRGQYAFDPACLTD
tara:strand:+ start:36147 stop:37208 length:1062 start_codon:yes stop_codon:yes gene_type:complete